MAHASRRTGLHVGRSVSVLVAGLVLAACGGWPDIDPSTIGGAEPADMIGDDPDSREAPTPDPDEDAGDDPGDDPGDDTRIARPDDLDELAVSDADDPWYLADGTSREAVGEVVEARLDELDHEAVCAYLDQEIDGPARARLRVPGADTAYPPDDPAAARRLTERAVLDLLDEEFGVPDLRLAASVTGACDLLVDLDRARIAARGSLNRVLDLRGDSYVDPRDDGWAAGDDVQDGDPAIDTATGRPFVEDGPRDAEVLSAWQGRLAPRLTELCAWGSALPEPQDLDTVLARLVHLRTGLPHDGLPSATEALAASCPELDALDWSAALSADADTDADADADAELDGFDPTPDEG